MVITEKIESSCFIEYCFLEFPCVFLKTAFAVYPGNKSVCAGCLLHIFMCLKPLAVSMFG